MKGGEQRSMRVELEIEREREEVNVKRFAIN